MMPKYAEYFATVSNGKIVLLTEAHPAHELLPNQVMLTHDEFRLLYATNFSLEKLQTVLNSVKYKIEMVKNEN